jgi:stringent starvation protein B
VSQPASTKPYFLRALYEWCNDNHHTPYLVVKVDEHTQVPQEYVRDGEIVLNIDAGATRGLVMENDWIFFSARFNGVSRDLAIPVNRVTALFAKETGEGMSFTHSDTQTQNNPSPEPPPRGKPQLKVVK